MGLSQVYGFIKQSRGHVAVYSEPTVGTTFKLYLPRDTRSANAGRPVARELAPQDNLPRGTIAERILVVEDDDQVRRTNVEALRDLGYTVHQAENGDAALKLLTGLPEIHLLFTDVVMPGMSGRDLAEVVRRQRPKIKLLFTTGYSRNAVVHDGTIDSNIDLLTKPYAVEQLARKVRGILDAKVL